MSAARAAAIALTVGAFALALPAAADDAPPGGTPLNVRPSRPLDLAPASSGSHVGATLTVVVAALGAGAWMWKRRATTATSVRRPSITILARQSIGVRSELLVVQIDGQSLLLGVTSGSIQRLAVLPDASDTIREVEDEPDAAEEPEARAIRRDLAHARRESSACRHEPPLEEQVRGLLRTRRSGS